MFPELESVVADMRSHGFKPKAKSNPANRICVGHHQRQCWTKSEALLTVGGKHWNYAHRNGAADV